MRISLPPIPSRWETIQQLVDEVETFNDNGNKMLDDALDLFDGTSFPRILSSRISDGECISSDEEMSCDELNAPSESIEWPMIIRSTPSKPKVRMPLFCIWLTGLDLFRDSRSPYPRHLADPLRVPTNRRNIRAFRAS